MLPFFVDLGVFCSSDHELLFHPLPPPCICTLASCFLLNAADEGKLGTKLYHGVSLALLAGVPLAVATSPSAITMPIDVVLGIAMPVHAHIGMNYGECRLQNTCRLDSDWKYLSPLAGRFVRPREWLVSLS